MILLTLLACALASAQGAPIINVDDAVTDRNGPAVADEPASAQEVPEPASPDGDTNPLGVTLELKSGTASEFSLLNFTLALQIETLTFVVDEKEELRRADVVTQFDLVARNGRVFPLETRKHSLTIAEAELANAETDFVDYSWQFDLSPLRFPDSLRQFRDGMSLQVTVEEPETGRRSIVRAPLRAPRRR